jgi:hypothetical protein
MRSVSYRQYVQTSCWSIFQHVCVGAGALRNRLYILHNRFVVEHMRFLTEISLISLPVQILCLVSLYLLLLA